MNFFSRMLCRSYQLCFKAAQPLLPYREPKIFASASEAIRTLAVDGERSVLLVTDGFIAKSDTVAEIKREADELGLRLSVYCGTCPNPTVVNIDEALGIYRRERCSALIAVGGGSAIDCCKAVGILAVYPKKKLSDFAGILKVRRRLPTVIAVPTTAGTGSEGTVTTVITDPVQHRKYTISDFPLIPRYAVHDPSAIYTLPPHLTATTGMDALTHAVEAYIGRSTCKKSRTYALDAVRLIFGNIELAYADGMNTEARRNMLEASYKAGIAFSMSYVGYIHAVAHSLGGQYNTPHGLANTVLLPLVLEEYGECVHKKLHRLAIEAGVANKGDSYAEGARKFIAAVKELNFKMDMPPFLSDIKKEDIPKMARHAAREANPLYPVPRLMNAQELERLYEIAADGRH